MTWKPQLPVLLVASLPALLAACQVLSGLSDIGLNEGSGGAPGSSSSQGVGGVGGAGGAGVGGLGGAGGAGGIVPSVCDDGLPAPLEHCGFHLMNWITVNAPLGDIVVGFFNKDAFLDLAVSDKTGAIRVYAGDGTGSFQQGAALSITGTPVDIATADVDADMKTDLIVANNAMGTVQILLNDGSGAFNIGPSIPVGSQNSPMRLSVGHVDASKELDLVIVQLAARRVVVHSGVSGLPYFSSSEILIRDTMGAGGAGGGPTSKPSGLAVFQLDNDKEDEIVISDYGLGSVVGFLDASNVALTTEIAWGDARGPTAIAAGDIDGDKDFDLVTANIGESRVGVVLNNSGQLLDKPPTIEVGAAPTNIFLVDLNRDGVADVITTNLGADIMGNDTLTVLLNDGKGSFTRPPDVVVGSDPTSVAAGDFNGDGLVDLAVCHQASNNIAILLANPL